MRSIACSMAIVLFVLMSCKRIEKTAPDSSVVNTPFIQPPLPEAGVPFKKYAVIAEKGDTLFPTNSGIILFPPNSFVDKSGKIISGEVQVSYREFSDPLDFYLSGIPMNYDSAGKQYPFESSGMMELLASQKGVPVYINPASKPEIILSNTSTSPAGNLYFLDTVQRKWVNKGKPTIIDLKTVTKKENTIFHKEAPAEKAGMIKPLRPEKAPEGSTVLRIVIDPASFAELLVYDNLKFQIDPNNNNFLPKDAQEEWSDVKLQKGQINGLYTVIFSNKNRTVSYSAKPVLEGEDYEKAMKLFDEKNVQYELLQKERLAWEADARAKTKLRLTKDSIENQQMLAELEKIDELNKLIDKRNAKLAARNKEIEKENIETLRKRNELEIKLKDLQDLGKKQNEERIELMKKQKKELELQIKEQADRRILRIDDEFMLQNTVQRFAIDGFGAWNCDRIQFINVITLLADFKNLDGNTIDLKKTAVVSKSTNGIIPYNNNLIAVAKYSDNMIFGVYRGRFAYLTFADYRSLHIGSDTKQQTFVMKTVSKEENNYAFIKQLVKQQ
jgi:hypothetical protein